MALLKPDPTFYPSPTLATQSPAEKLAYLTLISPPAHGQRDRVFRGLPVAVRGH